MTAPALDPVVLEQGLRALAEHHEDIPHMDVLSIVDVLLHEVRTGVRYETWDHITAACVERGQFDCGLTDVDRYGPWTCPRDEAIQAVRDRLHREFEAAIAAAVALHQEEVGRRG